MRIIFMGTSNFAVSSLQALHAAGHKILYAYCQPPRRAGRGKKLCLPPLAAYAQELNIPLRTPLNFNHPKIIADFITLNADIAIIVAYGLILPKVILKAPAHGCLNVHPSLLPRWRGAAPIERAIMNNDAYTGVCLMQMNTKLDAGGIIARQKIPITLLDTAKTLRQRLAAIASTLLIDTLSDLDSHSPQQQSSQGVIYAKKIHKNETRIDWWQNSQALYCHIRALSPMPGAWFYYQNQRIKVLMSQMISIPNNPKYPAGTVLDDSLTIATGQGAIQLLRLQRAGKNSCDAADFLRGLPIGKGHIL